MKQVKIFSIVFLIATSILVIMSVIALIAIHMDFFDRVKYSFSFSPQGINDYFLGFSKYKLLFTGTVSTIVAYLGLIRLKLLIEANKERLKQDRFSEWKTNLEIRLIETEKSDPYMKREFTRIRLNLFNQLYDNNFSILNKEQLTNIFNSIFKDIVNFLETLNNRQLGMGGAYVNDKHSYSFISFRFVLLGSIENIYDGIIKDLNELYLGEMDAERIINSGLYKSALQNYKQINL